jgi:hypothetical protein
VRCVFYHPSFRRIWSASAQSDCSQASRLRTIHCFRINFLSRTESGKSAQAAQSGTTSKTASQAACAIGNGTQSVGQLGYYLPAHTGIGSLFYLYLFIDIFSRKIIGWQVYDTESSELASDVMRDICMREKIAPDQVVLHSDNGSPMKGATLLATLQALGVTPSFSRPAVSNDNPYLESLFKTMKYRPAYPSQAFESLLAARRWVGMFIQWYNHEHRHSAIRFVTPAERHANLDTELLQKRANVYEEAKKRHPERWSGVTRNWHDRARRESFQITSVSPSRIY